MMPARNGDSHDPRRIDRGHGAACRAFGGRVRVQRSRPGSRAAVLCELRPGRARRGRRPGAVRLRPSAALGPHPAGGGTQAAVVAQPGHPRGDAPRFAERLDQQGIARITAPAGADDGGIWIAGPDGLPLQLRAAPKSSPSAPAPQTPPQPCANAGRAPPAAARRAFSRCTCRTSCCSAPMWRGPRASMWTCSACACRTRPAT